MSDIRGWWRRWSAKNVDPWPAEELERLNLEAEAVRRRNRRVVRPERRRQALRTGRADS